VIVRQNMKLKKLRDPPVGVSLRGIALVRQRGDVREVTSQARGELHRLMPIKAGQHREEHEMQESHLLELGAGKQQRLPRPVENHGKLLEAERQQGGSRAAQRHRPE